MPSPIPLPPWTPWREFADAFTPIVDLLPLPQEIYPRAPDSPKRKTGYYVALCVILLIWSITPLSIIYLICFAALISQMSGGARNTAIVFAVYAGAETAFAIYYYYLVHHVQAHCTAVLPMETRDALVLKVLDVGIGNAAEKARLRHPETMNDILQSGDNEGRIKREVDHTESVESGEVAQAGGTILSALDNRAVEFRERLRTWFNYAPWESLRRQNILMWLSWICFNQSLTKTQEDPQHATYLDQVLRKLEARTGSDIPEGFDPDISVYRPTLDPVKAKGRPLLLYAIPSAFNAWLKFVVYPCKGLRIHKDGDIEYLVYMPPDWKPHHQGGSSHPVPVVYLQGLGLGLLHSYISVKRLLKLLPAHPLLIPLSPYTSQAVFHPRHLRPWTRPELVTSVKRICSKLGFWEQGSEGVEAKGGVSILSHSNGSVAHCWILKDCPSLTKRNTFVDPVVFCSWEGDITRSFVYRSPTTALELLLLYFIASEVGIAHYIQRHWDWADNTLFLDEIPDGKDPRRTAFSLGGKDFILDAGVSRFQPESLHQGGLLMTQRTRKYLEDHGVTAKGLHWDAEAGHGGGLEGESRDRVIRFAGTGSTRGSTRWLKQASRPAAATGERHGEKATTHD